MKADEEDKQNHLPSVSGPSLGPAIRSTPPEVEGYEILRVLGEGGMGVVYLARQQVSVQRQVALKIVKPGMDSKQVVTRFESERQALALLDHPNIAHVYDAGTTKDGHPYFSMEYVSGLPITEYCDKYRLSIDERLELFIQVCEGVQHAHQKGIIHRDIKPSNVLVYKEGDKPLPKIIDFGVAKALTAPLTEKTFFTEQGQLLGTPEYMSPEQAEMNIYDIDTRSDIYSLGIVLYELLTGALPFERREFEQIGFAEILRTIREQDPPRPSTRLSSLGDNAKLVANSRRTQVKALAKRLCNELEWIPLKAMRKERSRRYESAAELARDIQSYLKGDPLIAGPESVAYRMNKFMRRNHVVVTAAAVVLIVLVTATVISIVFAVGQARERARAEQRRAEAELQARMKEAVVDFLNYDLLASGSPARAKGRDVTVRDALDRASQQIVGRFDDDPLVEASIRHTLGTTYNEIGLYEKAEAHLERALEIFRNQSGEEYRDTITAMDSLGILYKNQGRYDEANQLFNDSLKVSLQVLGEENRITLNIMNNQANLYRQIGQFAKAEQILMNTFWIKRRTLGPEHPDTLRTMTNRGIVCRRLGQYKKAEVLLCDSLEMKQRILGKKDPDTLIAMHALAQVYREQGRYTDAQPLYLETVEISKPILGEVHPNRLMYMHNLSLLYREQKQYKQAESLLLELYELEKRAFGERYPDTIHIGHDLIALYEAWDKLDEAHKWRMRLHGDEADNINVEGHKVKQMDKPQDHSLPVKVKPITRKAIYADIFREAVAHQLGTKPEQLIDEDFKKIEQLDLSHLKISDIKPLEVLTQLKRLYLHDTKVSNLEPLMALTNLRELRLSRTPVTNLEPLTALTKLRRLWIDGTPTSDLAPLSVCTELELLDIGYTRVSNLDSLQGLTKLKKLWLPATWVCSLDDLKELRNLEELYLWNTSVNDLKPLARLTNLCVLNLSQTMVSNIEPLKALTNLKLLNIDRTKINNIEHLRNLTLLKQLYLAGILVADLEPLVGLTNLQMLCLADTQVKDLSPLKALVYLKEIHLGGLDVSDEQVMELQNTLRGLKIVRQKVEISE